MEMMKQSCEQFLAELAGKAPTPGGGGTAALVGPSAHFSMICSGTAQAASSALSSTVALRAACSGVSFGRP